MQYPDTDLTENSETLQRALELCSAARDGELTLEESAELDRYRGEFSEQMSAFEARMEWLSRVLGSDVVRPLEAVQDLSGGKQTSVGGVVVGSVVIDAVHREIREIAPTVEGLPVRGRELRRGWSHNVVAFVSLAAMVLMVSAVTIRPDSKGAASGVRTVQVPGLGMDQPLAMDQPQGWRVVVVAAKAGDRDKVLGRLKEFVEHQRIRSQESTAAGVEPVDEVSDRIVLEGDRATSEQFVSELQDAELIDIPSWDPEAVGTMTREQLIAAVRRSQQTPSLSERHFGIIRVELSDSNETAIVRSDGSGDAGGPEGDSARQPGIKAGAPARNVPSGSNRDVKVSSASGVGSGQLGSTAVEQPISALSGTEAGRYCLVVLEFSKADGLDAGESVQHVF